MRRRFCYNNKTYKKGCCNCNCVISNYKIEIKDDCDERRGKLNHTFINI